MFDTGDLKIIGFNKQQENCHLAVLIYRWLFVLCKLILYGVVSLRLHYSPNV